MSFEPKIVELTPQPAAVIKMKTSMEKISDDLGRAYEAIPGYLQRTGIPMAGPPFAIYHAMNGTEWTVSAGFPVNGPVQDEGEITAGETPGGKAAMAVHTGPYDTLKDTWSTFAEWFREQGYNLSNVAWESYITDPDAEPDSAKWQTLLYWHIDA